MSLSGSVVPAGRLPRKAPTCIIRSISSHLLSLASAQHSCLCGRDLGVVPDECAGMPSFCLYHYKCVVREDNAHSARGIRPRGARDDHAYMHLRSSGRRDIDLRRSSTCIPPPRSRNRPQARSQDRKPARGAGRQGLNRALISPDIPSRPSSHTPCTLPGALQRGAGAVQIETCSHGGAGQRSRNVPRIPELAAQAVRGLETCAQDFDDG